jgi:hypothetical protein
MGDVLCVDRTDCKLPLSMFPILGSIHYDESKYHLVLSRCNIATWDPPRLLYSQLNYNSLLTICRVELD